MAIIVSYYYYYYYGVCIRLTGIGIFERDECSIKHYCL